MLRNTDTACVAIALALCLNVLSDIDAACMANALAPCLNKKKENSPLDQSVVQT